MDSVNSAARLHEEIFAAIREPGTSHVIDLMPDTAEQPPAGTLPTRAEMQRLQTLDRLVFYEGNRLATAESLGISYRQLIWDLKAYARDGYVVPEAQKSSQLKTNNKSRRANKWNENDDDLLIKLATLYASGWAIKKIAEVDDFSFTTPAAIGVKLSQSGITKRCKDARNRSLAKLKQQEKSHGPTIKLNRWAKLDPVIEELYQKHIGQRQMLQDERLRGVELSSLANRITSLKLVKRFPEAAAEIRKKRKSNRKALKGFSTPTQIMKLGNGMPERQPQTASYTSPFVSERKALPHARKPARPDAPSSVLSVSPKRQAASAESDKLVAEFLAQRGVNSVKEYQTSRDKGQEKQDVKDPALPVSQSLEAANAPNLSPSLVISDARQTASTDANTVLLLPAAPTSTLVKSSTPAPHRRETAFPTARPRPVAEQQPKPAAPARKYHTPAPPTKGRSWVSQDDIENFKNQIQDRKKKNCDALLAAFGHQVTQSIMMNTSTVDPNAHDRFSRELLETGFSPIKVAPKTTEQEQPAKEAAECVQYFIHPAGLIAEVVRLNGVDDHAFIHAQIINSENTQPNLAQRYGIEFIHRYTAQCEALGGLREVACVTIPVRGALASTLIEMNRLLNNDHNYALRKCAVPPRISSQHGVIAFNKNNQKMSDCPAMLKPFCHPKITARFKLPTK